jgi:hypothetical protein
VVLAYVSYLCISVLTYDFVGYCFFGSAVFVIVGVAARFLAAGHRSYFWNGFHKVLCVGTSRAVRVLCCYPVFVSCSALNIELCVYICVFHLRATFTDFACIVIFPK